MADFDIKAAIRFVLEAKSLDEAVTKIKELEKGEKGAGQGGSFLASSIGEIATKVGGMVASFFAVKKAFDFIDKSVTDLALFNRRLEATANSMRAMGIDADAAIPRITDFLNSLAEVTGYVDDDTLPAFQRFIGLTGDVEAALGATKLAADIARAGFGDVGQTAELVSNILAGRAAMAARQLGVNIKDVNGQTKTNEQLMRDIIARFGDYSEKAAGAGNATGKLSAAWDRFGDAIGAFFTPAWNFGKEFLAWLTNSFVTKLEQITIETKSFAFTIAEYAELAWAYISGKDADAVRARWNARLQGLIDDYKKVGQSQVATTKLTEEQKQKLAEDARRKDIDDQKQAAVEAAKATAAIAKELEQSKVDLAKEGTAERLAAELGAIETERREKLAAENLTARDRELINETYDNRRRAAINTFNDARVKADTAAEQAVLRSKAQLQKEGTRAWLTAELAALDAEQRAALDSFRGTALGRLSIEEEFSSRRAAARTKVLQQEFDDFAKQFSLRIQAERDAAQEQQRIEVESLEYRMEQLKQFGIWTTDESIREYERLARERIRILNEELAAEAEAEIIRTGATGSAAEAIRAKYRVKTLANERAHAIAIDTIHRWQEMNKLERSRSVAQLIDSVNIALFHNNKSIAIAAAVIDTIAASIEAFRNGGGWPWGLVPMGITLAMGYAKVQEIRAADVSKGSGFDDPRNDAAARQGGARWADDMIRNFREGIDAGWAGRLAAIGGAGSSSSVSTTNNTYDQASHNTTNVNLYGPVVGGRAGLRELYRLLLYEGRLDQGRIPK